VLECPTYKTGYARDANESESPELWNGLVGAWCPFLGVTGKYTHGVSATAGVWLPNLITGKKLTIANDFDEQRFKKQNGISVFSRQNSGSYPDVIENLAGMFSTEASVFFRFKFLAGSNTNSLPFGPSAAARTHYVLTSGNLLYLAVFATTRRINGVTAVGMDVTSWHSACITSKPGAGNYKFYYNGKLRNTGTGDSTIANIANASLFTNQPSTDASSGINGVFSAIYLHNRALTASEVLSLHVDETSPLQPRRRVYSVPAAGGGGSSVSVFMHHYKTRRAG
jgi:hypothetical protein